MLGDIWVYKKTSRIYVTLLLLAVIMLATQNWQLGVLLFIIVAGCIVYTKRCDLTQETVSYTHLTLPTNSLV